MKVPCQSLPLIRHLLEFDMIPGQVQNLEIRQIIPDRLVVRIEAEIVL